MEEGLYIVFVTHYCACQSLWIFFKTKFRTTEERMNVSGKCLCGGEMERVKCLYCYVI